MLGYPHLHFKEVDSTNAVARRQIEKNEASEGMLITADEQTQGRGQYGRFWISGRKENILMSVILSPSFLPVLRQFDLNIIVSLAVSRVVSNYCDRVKVKWPNDIYIGDKKVAGILIQNFIQGQQIAHSIIGIGLNVFQKSWPVEIPNATSLTKESGSDVKIPELVHEICSELNNFYNKLRQGLIIYQREYEEQLFRMNEQTDFYLNEEVHAGIIRGIDEIGQLKIEHSGTCNAYNHGQIKLII